MKAFIHENFMLNNKPAQTLYHEYAKDLPIIDFHCHLIPQEIAENRPYDNISAMWLAGDHYKWRALRTLGIEEKYITGDASDKEKFMYWAKAVPHTLGNPLYHWTHLELKRYFGIDSLLNEHTAEQIWEEANDKLQTVEFTPKKLIEKSHIEMICTTDDPLDSLEFHQSIKGDEDFSTEVLPTFRPDELIDIEKPTFNGYVGKLKEKVNFSIENYTELLKAIDTRVSYFHDNGCRVSDHGLKTLPYHSCSFDEAASVFDKVYAGETVTKEEVEKYQTYTLLYLSKLYSAKGWVMQLHIGALRNNNQRMFQELGANTGFDSINDFQLAEALNNFLNELERTNELPKSIIYNLNPVQNDVIASAIGNFQSAGVKGKIQLGSGWWFNDQRDGMERQMKDLGKIGLLSCFVGMLTDSRSILSYTRHEYFRRVLANLIGSWIECGEAPEDYELTGNMIRNICYYNSKEYFKLSSAVSASN